MRFTPYSAEELLEDLELVAGWGCECKDLGPRCETGPRQCWPGKFERAARTLLEELNAKEAARLEREVREARARGPKEELRLPPPEAMNGYADQFGGSDYPP